MQIYLIRHADAVDGEDDAARPLSPQGRRQIRAMAAFLKYSDLLEARELWHSPLVRARTTTELLVARLGIKAKLLEVAGLGPWADPAIMAKRLEKVRRSVAVVGHEPHLSALATLLLTGRVRPSVVIMKKGAMAALERSDRRWVLRWLVSPENIQAAPDRRRPARKPRHSTRRRQPASATRP